MTDSIFNPIKTGYYSVLVTDKDGCSSLSNAFLFDCDVLLLPLLLEDSLDNSLHISCIGGSQPYSYQWFIDSIPVRDINNSLLNIYTYGTYYVIIEDVNECRSFTNTINKKKLEINIFPNPTNKLINIQFQRLLEEKYTIFVFDIYMNIVNKIVLPVIDYNILYTHSINLDISKSGTYLIRLESTNNQISKRFIYME